MIDREKFISRENIFNGKVFTVHKDAVEIANGKIHTREVVEHNGGVAVLPITSDGKILLVRQHRYAVNLDTLELPAGKLEKGENPRQCGIRELQEETGMIAQNFDFLCAFYPTPAYCTEKIHIYIASGLTFTQTNFDEGESIETVELDLACALDMIKNGEIQDGKTALGICFYQANIIK